ncbi:hypothetical protein GGR53DRAFT_80313 [Hypoxylon sp. FL1150]|nr:hypothetical protein GGR53DRAFT_80313 [Hypoxylon sp. FL1150]
MFFCGLSFFISALSQLRTMLYLDCFRSNTWRKALYASLNQKVNVSGRLKIKTSCRDSTYQATSGFLISHV